MRLDLGPPRELRVVPWESPRWQAQARLDRASLYFLYYVTALYGLRMPGLSPAERVLFVVVAVAIFIDTRRDAGRDTGERPRRKVREALVLKGTKWVGLVVAAKIMFWP